MKTNILILGSKFENEKVLVTILDISTLKIGVNETNFLNLKLKQTLNERPIWFMELYLYDF